MQNDSTIVVPLVSVRSVFYVVGTIFWYTSTWQFWNSTWRPPVDVRGNRVSAQTRKLQPRRLLVNQKSVVFWKKSLTRQCSKIRRRKVQFSSVKSGILEKIQHSAHPTADPVGLRQKSSRYSILESPFLAREREYIMYASKVLRITCYWYVHCTYAKQ